MYGSMYSVCVVRGVVGCGVVWSVYAWRGVKVVYVWCVVSCGVCVWWGVQYGEYSGGICVYMYVWCMWGAGGGTCVCWFLNFLQPRVHLAAISSLRAIEDRVRVIPRCTTYSKTKQLKTVSTYHLSLHGQEPTSGLMAPGFL